MTLEAINPRGHYLHTIRNNTSYETIADAISEFIDNSLADNKGNASIIYVEYQRKQDMWLICDNGVGSQDVRSLFRLGDTTSWDDDSDVGGYGQGATAAAIWMADTMTVFNIPKDGVPEKGHADWEEQSKKETIEARFTKTKPRKIRVPNVFESDHGLLIKLGDLHHDRIASIDGVIDKLEFRYAQALKAGKQIVVRFNTKEPYHLKPATDVDLEHQILIDGEIDGVRFTGRAGLMVKPRRSLNAAFVSYRSERLVDRLKPHEIMGDKRTDRFYCEVVLEPGWKDRLSPSKTRIARYRDELCEEIERQCQVVLDIGQKQREDILIDDMLSDIQSQMDDVKLITKPGRRLEKDALDIQDGDGDEITDSGTNVEPVDGIELDDGIEPVLVRDENGERKKKAKNGIQLAKDLDGSKLVGRIVETEQVGDLIVVTINCSNLRIRKAAEKPRQDLAIQTLVTMSIAEFIETHEQYELLPDCDWEDTLGDASQSQWRMSKAHSYMFDKWTDSLESDDD